VRASEVIACGDIRLVARFVRVEVPLMKLEAADA